MTRTRKKKEKEPAENAAENPPGACPSLPGAVRTCSMGKTDSKSELRHGKTEEKKTESTVGRSVGLLTGPENQVGSKACRSAGKEVGRKKVMKGKGEGDENASDNERKEGGEGE